MVKKCMTQREFWAAIEARTSKEVADFGFEGISEDDLPCTSEDEDSDAITCTDLDAAAEAAKHAYEAYREAQADAAFDRFFSRSEA